MAKLDSQSAGTSSLLVCAAICCWLAASTAWLARQAQAAAALQSVLHDYPDSPMAARANEQLERLWAGGDLTYDDLPSRGARGR